MRPRSKASLLLAATCLMLCACSDSRGVHDMHSGKVGHNVAASISPEETEFTCPGVPDSSVRSMFDSPRFTRSYIGDNHSVSRIYCSVNGPGTGPAGLETTFGKWVDGLDPWGDSRYYEGEIVEHFHNDGGSGEIRYSEEQGGGAAMLTCSGDQYYVIVSVYPRSSMKGDLKNNLINLTESMTPWVCGGQNVPGLSVPLEGLSWDSVNRAAPAGVVSPGSQPS